MNVFRTKDSGKRKPQPRTLRLEQLERRDLLSIDLIGTALTISGTDKADTARVDVVPDPGVTRYVFQVQLNGKSQRFSPVEVTEIVFDGGRGADYFCNNTGLPVTAYGGPGNDTLIGGSGADRLYGNEDDDRLEGRNGNDRLYGNENDDQLIGGSGDDRLYGGTGNDSLSGGRGDDHLYGNDNNDTLAGDQGNDVIYGGGGDDTLYGNDGDDLLYGDSDNDRLIGGLGSDSIRGGGGDDGLFGGCDASQDHLWGDTGADRFLTRMGDRMEDLGRSDVEIRFVDGVLDWEEPWTDAEVAVIDKAFALLQTRANTTRVLKDSLTDAPLNFVKEEWGVPRAGRNYRWFEDGQWHRTIYLTDWDETDPTWNSERMATTVHEMAHNWDQPDEAAGHLDGGEYWTDFERLHDESSLPGDFPVGWTSVRDMAEEDWAACWEVAFGFRPLPADATETLLEKLAIVDAFFAEFVPV